MAKIAYRLWVTYANTDGRTDVWTERRVSWNIILDSHIWPQIFVVKRKIIWCDWFWTRASRTAVTGPATYLMHIYQRCGKLFKTGCAIYFKTNKKWVCKIYSFLNWGSKSGCPNAHPCALGSHAPMNNLLNRGLSWMVGMCISYSIIFANTNIQGDQNVCRELWKVLISRLLWNFDQILLFPITNNAFTSEKLFVLNLTFPGLISSLQTLLKHFYYHSQFTMISDWNLTKPVLYSKQQFFASCGRIWNCHHTLAKIQFNNDEALCELLPELAQKL